MKIQEESRFGTVKHNINTNNTNLPNIAQNTEQQISTIERWGCAIYMDIISPRYRLYLSLGDFKAFNRRSLYDFLDNSGINFVALQFCTRSNLSISIFLFGYLTLLAYSKCDLTRDLYKITKQFIEHTHTFNGPFSGTTQVSRYQKGKTNLDFTEARDGEWQ